MLQSLTRNWWLVVLRGVLAIAFGVATFIWPNAALQALIILFGAYALADGILYIATAISGSAMSSSSRWLLVLGGVAGIIVGLLTFFYPGTTATLLLYFIGAWAIVTGIFEVMAAIQLRQEIDNEWLLILSGVLSVIFGVLVFVYPSAGALSILWLIGFYAILYGVLIVALGFRVKSLDTTLKDASSSTT
jgi:uncharacterized membrane protein HdeD (DUF308 family)